MTTDLNDQVERASAQNFVEWYNERTGRQLVIAKAKPPEPDFVCTDAVGRIGLEITTVAYNQETHAQVAKFARQKPQTQQLSGVIIAPEEKLVSQINDAIRSKCANSYGSNCILAVRVVAPALTLDHEFEEEVVPRLTQPRNCKFKEIYVTMNQKAYFEVDVCSDHRRTTPVA